MDEAPAVSVLLPVRNAMPHLAVCLESLEKQSLRDLEVLAVDDGSTDGSGELLERWAAKDSRYRVFREPACGLVGALNLGLAACRAPLVARMDGDDVSHPDRLLLQRQLLDGRPEVGVVSSLVRHYPHSGVGDGFKIYEAWLNSLVDHDAMARERFIESPVAHPSVMVRSEILLQAGGYRDRDWPEDYDLWLRLFEAGVLFDKVRRPLFFWREHPRRLTRHHTRYTTDAFLRCKAHFLVRGPLSKIDGVVVWGAGRTGRLISRYLIAEGITPKAFVDIDPRKVGGVARGRPIVAVSDLEALLDGRTVVVAAVGSRGARGVIRDNLVSRGLEEGSDFWCVA
jgi:glycosyltransferase involved in cell wall biosynthesis